MSDFSDFLASRARLDSLLGTPQDAENQFIHVAPAGTAGPVPQLVNAGGDAIITNEGITVTNGAITVTNAASTVVIDGTSDMFKIQATGTITAAWPAATFANTAGIVTLTGMVISHVVPQALGSVTPDINQASPAARYDAWLAIDGAGAVAKYASWFTQESGSTPGNLAVVLRLDSGTTTPGASITGGMRYYILKEAGI